MDPNNKLSAEEATKAWTIGVIGLLGLLLNTIYTQRESLLPSYTLWFIFPIITCRLLGLNRTSGAVVIILSFTLGGVLLENFQLALLFLLSGVLLNGLVIFINGGMPVQNITSPSGIHIPISNRTKFFYLCDLSALGRWSIGDLLIIIGLWTHIISSSA